MISVQVIKAVDATFQTKHVGDVIRISQQNFWEIVLNLKTGMLESWKVFHAFFLFLFFYYLGEQWGEKRKNNVDHFHMRCINFATLSSLYFNKGLLRDTVMSAG